MAKAGGTQFIASASTGSSSRFHSAVFRREIPHAPQYGNRVNDGNEIQSVRNMSARQASKSSKAIGLSCILVIYPKHRLDVPSEIMVRNNLKCSHTNPTVQGGNDAGRRRGRIARSTFFSRTLPCRSKGVSVYSVVERRAEGLTTDVTDTASPSRIYTDGTCRMRV